MHSKITAQPITNLKKSEIKRELCNDTKMQRKECSIKRENLFTYYIVKNAVMNKNAENKIEMAIV